MADLEKTVAVLFKGVDNISGTMNSISGSLGNFGGKLESATQPLASMALMIEKVDAALVLLAAGAMVASVTAAGNFVAGLNEIHTLLRESPETVGAFDQAIEDYAQNSTQSLEDIDKAIYQSLSANVSYGESIKFISDAEKLAVAGKSTLAEAVDLLTSTLTAYGEGWDQAGKYSDVFFKTVEIGKVTIPELSQSLALVAPIAGAAGISIEQVGAAVAALTAGGLKAGPAAEYLRQAIQGVIDPSKEGRTEMDRLGIAYGGTALSAKGFSGIMADIWEKTNGNIDVLTKMFGNVQSLTTVMTLGKDASGYYAKALEDLANAAGATDRAYGIMVDNFGYINQRLINTMKLALIESGKPLLDDWANIADGLGEVFKGVKVGLKDGAFDEIYNEIDNFANSFGDYLRGIAAAMPEAMKDVDFDAFLKSIKNLGSSAGEIFKALFGDLDLTKPADLALAMQKVVDGVTKLTQVSKGILDELKPFAEKMGELATGALDADGKTAELTGKILGFGQGVNTAVSALGNLAPAMNIFSGALILNAISTIGSIGAALAAAPWIVAAAGLTAIGYAANSLNPPIDLAMAKFDEFGYLVGNFDNMASPAVKSLGEISREMNDLPEIKTFSIDAETGSATEKFNALNASILSFPSDFSIGVSARIDLDSIGSASALMNDIPREYTADFFIEADKDSIERTKNTMIEIVNPDGSKYWVNVGVDAESMKRTEAALKEIPTEKMLEIKLQGNIDKDLALIKTGAETVQAAMQWKAQVDIAAIEGETKRIEAMFSTIGSTITSVSGEIGDLFSKIPKSEFDFGARDWKKSIEQAMKIQQEAFDLEKTMIEAQIKSMKIKNDMMLSGKALIKIDSTGLEPALEMIMYQILQKVQIKANEESTNFLLGIR
ncbi:MAG: phage tail tape measure protein [Pseudomonadota bacterium]